ncbi:unnamed protein product [Cochlearia groenlandica]
MAAYFHGNPPEISAGSDGGLQTLILMNPTTYVQYTQQQEDDSNNNNNNTNNNHHHHNNNNSFVFLDSHAPPQNASQQFVGIPLSGHEAASITAADNISVLHGYPPRVQYNLYNSHQVDPTQQQQQQAACETPRAQRGLSLSLSSQQQQQQQQNHHNHIHQIGFGSGPGDDIRVGQGSTTGSGVTNGIANLVSSKYLKAAQELLDEVVNADSNDINTKLFSSKKGSSGNNDKVIGESSTGGGGEGSGVGGEGSGKATVELATAERQEIQMKKAKLSSMLHEVEQRYRQYHQQMQMVISSFEQAAGIGSAKSYTSLALKTISRQFRCLKEAISGQIKAANKSLGEEDSSVSGVGRFEGSRLKFVDHHLRQQRALQQLGMIQHPNNNAWRPQRGLPERAVSVLRAWLFEHFLHPYPKDSDKHMLAKQTGLTRSQVSNWFINARVRLWKPMVEEMYMEEMKEQGKNIEKLPMDQNNEDSGSKSTSNQEKSPMGGDTNYHMNPNHHNGDLEGVTGMQGSPKRLRPNEETMMQPINTDFTSNEKLTMKILEERQGIRSDGGYPFMGSFGQYQIDEMSRFDVAVSDQELLAQRYSGNNNGVSLTLGLPHCDSMSSTQHQNFMQTHHGIPIGRRVKIGENVEYGATAMNGGDGSAATAHSSATAVYNGMNIQNQKRYVAQLLPDFVA